jgi:hypothetical protein
VIILFNIKHQDINLYNTRHHIRTPPASIYNPTDLLLIRMQLIFAKHLLLCMLNLSETPPKNLHYLHVSNFKLPSKLDNLLVFLICTHKTINPRTQCPLSYAMKLTVDNFHTNTILQHINKIRIFFQSLLMLTI